jgi:hypothetical protein
MNLWNEIKKGYFYIGFLLFNKYVDFYLLFHKLDVLKFIFLSKVKLIEPDISEWVSIFSLYNIRSKYELCDTYIDEFINIKEEYILFCNKRENFYELENGINEHLFLAKKNGTYISRCYFPRNDMIQKEISFVQSRVEFVYVEYSHPNMNSTVELIIPEGMWVVGNQLFTAAFILRLLQLQCKYYFFDMEYKINIIDHDIQNLVLTSDSYIILDLSSYSIQSILII